MNGTLTVEGPGTSTGNIRVYGDIFGPNTLIGIVCVNITGDMSGDIKAWGDIVGDVIISGNMSGDLLATGAITRTVAVTAPDLFTGNICASNLSAGQTLPPYININFGPGGQVCGWQIDCLADSDCDDGDQDTDDTCVDNWCEYTCNCTQCTGMECAPTVARPPHSVRKNRYISFAPTYSDSVAFQVEMTAGPGSTGVLGWVGQPDQNGFATVEADAVYPVG